MDNCRLVLEIRDGEILAEAEHASLEELAYFCGALECVTGLEAYRRGKPVDDIKTDMLELHQRAMEGLEDQIGRERG